MATGRQPFSGNTSAVIFTAILTQSPASPSRLNPELPAELERIITKALEKDRDLRYEHASEMRSDLKRLKRDTESGRSAATAAAGAVPLPTEVEAAKVSRPQRWRWKVLGATGALLLAGVALATLLMRPLPPPRVTGSVQVTNDGRPKFPPALTDGARLYFMATEANGTELYQVSTAGGEAVAVSTRFFLANLAGISSDGSQLLVQAWEGTAPGGPLWVYPALAGPRHRLGSVVSSDASWSPDGKTLAYARGNSLYLARSDGSESRKLLDVDGVPFWLRWSPDGRKLRFSLQDPKTGSPSLWDVSADGRNLHPLLPGWNNPHAECCGSWTPDGRYFVFQSSHNGRSDVWAIRAKTDFLRKSSQKPVQLTTGPMDFSGPVPSKDGKRLFVVGSQLRGELVHYDARSQQFVPYLSGISADGVSFSRDGKWVAYVASPEGTLWRSKLDGSERLQLTFPPMLVMLPRWSPDAKTLAFIGWTAEKSVTVYLISADGGSTEEIVQAVGDPGWSADGKSLVFSDRVFSAMSEELRSYSLKVLDLQTRQLTTLPASKGFYSPRWSPDGRYIAALRVGPETLQLFDLHTQKWEELAKITVGYPSWSRDSKYIYFDSQQEGEAAFYRLRISDKKLERIVSLKNLRLIGSNAWTGLALDDSPLVLRNAGTQEIYALDWEAP